MKGGIRGVSAVPRRVIAELRRGGAGTRTSCAGTKLKCSEFGEAIIKHMGGSAGAVEPKTKPAMARA